jgi:signal transduction histidine kinase/HAMP domain-containing protein/ActR/RegA family two-component response regulator
VPNTLMHLDDDVAGEALLGVLASVKAGDFSARMPLGWSGVPGKVADSLNELVIANQALETELARVSQAVGAQGRLSERMVPVGLQGWANSVASVNGLISDLVRPTVDMQRVIGAVADGDLSKKVSADVHGDTLELKNTINAMVDQLNGFISEVTRVVREVGTEGKLGQAAAVTIEVGGVWKDLTDNVNLMAANLTGQVRNIAEVTTSVANGDLSKKISIDVKGEFLELKDTVNAMVDQLNAFASEVTRVAREVGVEGKLGGQAQTTEINGVWKDLTDNVNLMAGNLTNQVRAIAEVATAVTDGDLTRQVRMEASGEVAALKETLNEMIGNLRETTDQNIEQDWLKTNRERFTRILQGQRDLEAVSNLILSELAPLVSAQHGVFYTMNRPTDAGPPRLTFEAGYGFEERKRLSANFALGEGLVGQCAKEKKRILMTEVPSDYVRISSGLGAATPLNVIVLPVLFEGNVRAVVELASFSAFSPIHLAFLDQLGESIGLVLHTIESTTLTEDLLEQAQSLAEELRASNEDLGRQAEQLAQQNIEAQGRNHEVEESKRMVEEKAGQLLLSSAYKSEFIANMSHELRTPLNSLLMLAEQLEDNPGENMTETQVEYARVIRESGSDLLSLLNGILDLAKVESGTIALALADVHLDQVCNGLRTEFTSVATASGLDFTVELSPGVPETIVTDHQRLRQVLRNLVANALKFTARGEVRVRVSTATDGWNHQEAELAAATSVVAISVIDTGIGIESVEQHRIFEPFAQADGSATRPYGGTGLGLSISRQLVSLLDGQISVISTPGNGSTFTVFLPVDGPSSPARVAVSPLELGGGAPRATSVIPVAAVPDKRAVIDYETGLLKDTRVLIVDDDYRNLFALTALLERAQAQVTTAESGSSALEILSGSDEVDLVLMDIMMPVMDGYATIRAIREVDRLKALPVIAVTGKVVQGERERCLDAGANYYIPKPVNAADLLEALTPWLQNKVVPA